MRSQIRFRPLLIQMVACTWHPCICLCVECTWPGLSLAIYARLHLRVACIQSLIYIYTYICTYTHIQKYITLTYPFTHIHKAHTHDIYIYIYIYIKGHGTTVNWFKRPNSHMETEDLHPNIWRFFLPLLSSEAFASCPHTDVTHTYKVCVCIIYIFVNYL